MSLWKAFDGSTKETVLAIVKQNQSFTHITKICKNSSKKGMPMQ